MSQDSDRYHDDHGRVRVRCDHCETINRVWPDPRKRTDRIECWHCGEVFRCDIEDEDNLIPYVETDGGTAGSDRYQDAIDVLEREIRERDHPQDDSLRLARRVLLAERGDADAPPVPSGGDGS